VKGLSDLNLSSEHGNSARERGADNLGRWGMASGDHHHQHQSTPYPSYEGFRIENLWNDQTPQPFLVSDFHEWHPVLPEHLVRGVDDEPPRMRCRRAMCWNFPAFFFSNGAEHFRAWERRHHGENTTGVHGRMQAHAALTSLMFAGLQQGLRTGSLKRGGASGSDAMDDAEDDSPHGRKPQKKAPGSSGPVFSYKFRPVDGAAPGTEWPMFELAHEDLYHRNRQDVLAVRVWLFVYDGEFSISELVGKVMRMERMKNAVSAVNGCEPGTRDRRLVNEVTRRQQAGYGPQQLITDFERHVASQFEAVTTMSAFQTALAYYSGGTTAVDGVGVVDNLEEYCAAVGGAELTGSKRGLGGESGLAPEHLFCGKRAEALRAGLADASGSMLDLCDEHLDPAEYWLGDGAFQLPGHLKDGEDQHSREFFWVMGHSNVTSPFQVRMPHPLSGDVHPGDELLRLTLMHLNGADWSEQMGKEDFDPKHLLDGEEDGGSPMQCERSQGGGGERGEGAPGESEAEMEDCCESRTANLNRFRSFASDRDVVQAARAELLRSELLPIDSMQREVGSLANIESLSKGTAENEFVVRVINECDLVRKESNRLHELVFLAYKSKRDAVLKRKENVCFRPSAHTPHPEGR
jgi:hypothetical protein